MNKKMIKIKKWKKMNKKLLIKKKWLKNRNEWINKQ